MPGNAWTREELVQALQLYCITPFGRIHSRNPDIRKLAEQIGRTPSAVALKMTNFASLDPTISQSGMANSSKLDREVWTEFFEAMNSNLALQKSNKNNEFDEQTREYKIEGITPREGVDVLRLVKTRLNQAFFRRLVLASYDNKCALSGIEAPELLIASHIVPWSENSSVRTAPENGICLNALHDRAFDQGFITFDENFSVIYSSQLPKVTRTVLESFGTNKLRLPTRFIPDASLLEFHRMNTFRG